MKTKTKVATILFMILAAILIVTVLWQRKLAIVTVDLIGQADQIASVKLFSSSYRPFELSTENEEMKKDIQWLVETLSGEYHSHKLEFQLHTSRTATFGFDHIQFYDKNGKLLRDISINIPDSHPRFILSGDESSRFILYYTSPYENAGNDIYEWDKKMDALVDRWRQ